MSRILVLGGYGGFGSAIVDRLRCDGHEVLVAGRSLARAKRFCGERPGLIPLRIDRRDIGVALADYRPHAVIDASGPFQVMDHTVPRACINARIPYCDIADSTAYVCDIGLLDAQAKQAGVPVLAGASSVPALSGAVIRELAQGMTHVTAVEMAISASNRASAGPAVAEAILSQVGQQFAVRSGMAEGPAFGWQDGHRITFAAPGVAALANRTVYLVDVPDVRLVPDRLPGTPQVTFRAGTELAFQNRVLWLLSWLVRWRMVASLAPLGRWIGPLQRLTARLGGARSAMVVRLFGIADGRRVERRWTLIAERGDGPRIPALTAPVLIRQILAGLVASGARDAGQALDLADYEPAFAGLAIHHAKEELPLPEPLYRRVMGSAFDVLPMALRQMHSVLREGYAEGEADVFGATNPVGRLIAAIMGFPRPGHCTLRVRFTERDGVERWHRQFGRCGFSSSLSQSDDCLIERFGALRFRFALIADHQGLTMHLRGWSLFHIPMPLALAPRADAREWSENGWFHFDVPIALPLIGRIIHYRGRLQSWP